MEEWDDAILSELSDLSFDLPPFEFEDDGSDEEEGECSSDDVKLDEAIVPSVTRKKLEVLIDVGEDHKKVVTLKDERDDLTKAFFKIIADDPELNELVGLKVMFKVFNEKFNTWVDYDTATGIIDGMHLKAVFQNKSLPNNTSRRRHRRHQSSRKRHYSDSSDDSVYEKELVKYRKLRKRKHNLDKSGGSSSHGLIHRDYGENFKPEENNCTFQTSQFDKNESLSYKSDHITKHTEDVGHYQEGEECFDEVGNLSGNKQKCLFSRGYIYRMSLGLTRKNPVSALHELCQRLKWNHPEFTLVKHEFVNPEYHFWMKVTVNGVDYDPGTPQNKKQFAKAAAAKYCLQKLGVFE